VGAQGRPAVPRHVDRDQDEERTRDVGRPAHGFAEAAELALGVLHAPCREHAGGDHGQREAGAERRDHREAERDAFQLQTDEQDTERYIQERLTIAGDAKRGEPLFAPDAVKAIHQYSRGFPRLINTICENALITGYARQLTTIPQEVIVGVAKDFHLNTNGSKIAKNGLGESDQDLERAKNFFLDLYAATQRGAAPTSDLSQPIPIKAGKHESNI